MGVPITKTRLTSSNNGSIDSGMTSKPSATPVATPARLAASKAAGALGPFSACTVMMSAPAAMKSSTWLRGSVVMKCTWKGFLVKGRSAATRSAKNRKPGTK